MFIYLSSIKDVTIRIYTSSCKSFQLTIYQLVGLTQGVNERKQIIKNKWFHLWRNLYIYDITQTKDSVIPILLLNNSEIFHEETLKHICNKGNIDFLNKNISIILTFNSITKIITIKHEIDKLIHTDRENIIEERNED